MILSSRRFIFRYKHLLPYLLLLSGSIIFILYTYLYFDHGTYSPHDDSFISFRYARNLARGEGLVYNPGERVEGYTNFLWTVLMGVAIALNVDVILAANLMSTIAGLVTLWIVYSFGVMEFKKPILAAATALMLAVTTSFARYAVAGSEMLLFTMLVILGLYYYARAINSGSAFVSSGLVFGFAGLVRPEGVFVFGIVTLHYLITLLSELLSTKEKAVKLIVWLASFGIIYIPYFIWRYNYYGYLFPNTFYVKVGEPSTALIARGLSYILYAVPLFNPQAVLLIASGFFWYGSKRTKTLLFTFIGLYIGYLVIVGGDFLAGFGPRFVIPLLPAIYLLGVGGVYGLTKRFNQYGRRLLGVTLFALLFLIFTIWSIPERTSFVALEETQHRGWVELAKWMSNQVAPGQVLAIDAAGIIPYYTDLYTIDMLGLNDLYIAHLDIVTGENAAGHEKFDPEYVLSQCPTYIGTYIDQNGQPNFFGLQEYADRINQSYSLWAVTLMRPPVQGESQILINPDFTPDLFNEGYVYGMLRLKKAIACDRAPL